MAERSNPPAPVAELATIANHTIESSAGALTTVVEGFKPGDRVEFTGKYAPNFKPGPGTVLKVTPGNRIHVRFDKWPSSRRYYAPHNLKAVS